MRFGGNSLKRKIYRGGFVKSGILNGSVFESNVRKNGHVLPTGQWYAPSAVINDVLHGIAWYCIVLPGIAWYCMVLHGIA